MGKKREIGSLRQEIHTDFRWIVGIMLTIWITIILTILFTSWRRRHQETLPVKSGLCHILRPRTISSSPPMKIINPPNLPITLPLAPVQSHFLKRPLFITVRRILLKLAVSCLLCSYSWQCFLRWWGFRLQSVAYQPALGLIYWLRKGPIACHYSLDSSRLYWSAGGTGSRLKQIAHLPQSPEAWQFCAEYGLRGSAPLSLCDLGVMTIHLISPPAPVMSAAL